MQITRTSSCTVMNHDCINLGKYWNADLPIYYQSSSDGSKPRPARPLRLHSPALGGVQRPRQLRGATARPRQAQLARLHRKPLLAAALRSVCCNSASIPDHFVNLLNAVSCSCSINGYDTCTELLLENKGSAIVSLVDSRGRLALLLHPHLYGGCMWLLELNSDLVSGHRFTQPHSVTSASRCSCCCSMGATLTRLTRADAHLSCTLPSTGSAWRSVCDFTHFSVCDLFSNV